MALVASCSASASVYMEWALKRSLATSMHTQNAQIYGWGVLLNALMYLTTSSHDAVPQSLTHGTRGFSGSMTVKERNKNSSCSPFTQQTTFLKYNINNYRIHAPHVASGRAPCMQRPDCRLATQALGLHHQDSGDFCVPFPDSGHQRRLAGHCDIREHDSWNDIYRF